MNLTTFNFDKDTKLRTINHKGEPWFVAKDMCDALEIVNSSDAMATINSEDTLRVEDVGICYATRDLPKTQTLVNEPGLYELIFKSRKDAAIKFKRWVTKEVLPSIRKTGSYTTPGGVGALGNQGTAFLNSYMEAGRILGASESVTRANAVQIASRLIPEIDYKPLLVENYSDTQEEYVTPTEIGKPLGLSGIKVNRILAEKGLQKRVNNKWVVTELGRTICVFLDVGKSNSKGTPIQQVKWMKEKVLKILNEE